LKNVGFTGAFVRSIDFSVTDGGIIAGDSNSARVIKSAVLKKDIYYAL
jgi:hypothetical protein